MQVEKCRGYVLKKRILPQNDQVIVLFTQEFGKVASLAKGIKSITSKRAPHVQTGNLLSLQIRNGMGMSLLQQTSLISAFQEIKKNQEKITYMYAFLFVLDKILPELVPEEEVFQLTTSFLTYLSQKDENIHDEFKRYIKRILSALGYQQDEEDEKDILTYTEEVIDAKIPLGAN